MKEQNKRVLLGMSGGTDSSVAALLLQEAGYEVTGITFRFYEPEGDTAYLDEARSMAKSLGIRHIVCDEREEFRFITNYFIGEYLIGHTPFPCARCNSTLKWYALIREADRLGIRYVATGHYAILEQLEGVSHIRKARDADKDQSFFLWGLGYPTLDRMILPLGNLLKAEVREIAARHGFKRIAEKRDSLGVCFCPGDYREFLKHQLPLRDSLDAVKGALTSLYPDLTYESLSFLDRKEELPPGEIVDEEGHLLGKHEGYPFYTVGQRRRLGLFSQNRPLFVKEIHPNENKVVVAEWASLQKQCLRLVGWNLNDWREVCNRDDVDVKIFYRKPAVKCRVTLDSDHRLTVQLEEPLYAVATGQAAVFYRGDVLLGGGIIEASW